MKLTTYPLHPDTGELLPAHHDAYLRGDLSTAHTAVVDAYVQASGARADATLRRYHELKQDGHAVRPVGWVQRQFELLRTEPRRLRRRAATLVAGAALVGGVVLAGTSLPTHTGLTTKTAPALEAADELVAYSPTGASAERMVTVRGRILDENGRPLVGATVLQKGSFRGVSTDRPAPAGRRSGHPAVCLRRLRRAGRASQRPRHRKRDAAAPPRAAGPGQGQAPLAAVLIRPPAPPAPLPRPVPRRRAQRRPFGRRASAPDYAPLYPF